MLMDCGDCGVVWCGMLWMDCGDCGVVWYVVVWYGVVCCVAVRCDVVRRSVYWKLLLDYLPCNRSEWVSVLKQKRELYYMYTVL